MIEYAALAHSIFVHFPIALLTVAAIIESIKHFLKLSISNHVTFACLIIGTLMSIPAVAMGIVASNLYGFTTLVTTHMVLGITTSVASMAGLFTAYKTENKTVRFIITVVLAALVGITGFFGGEIIRGTFL